MADNGATGEKGRKGERKGCEKDAERRMANLDKHLESQIVGRRKPHIGRQIRREQTNFTYANEQIWMNNMKLLKKKVEKRECQEKHTAKNVANH